MASKNSKFSPDIKESPKVEKKLTMEEYLAQGKIGKKLYDIVNKISKEDKKARVIEKLHRRIAGRGTLPDL